MITVAFDKLFTGSCFGKVCLGKHHSSIQEEWLTKFQFPPLKTFPLNLCSCRSQGLLFTGTTRARRVAWILLGCCSLTSCQQSIHELTISRASPWLAHSLAFRRQILAATHTQLTSTVLLFPRNVINNNWIKAFNLETFSLFGFANQNPRKLFLVPTPRHGGGTQVAHLDSLPNCVFCVCI